MKTFWFDFTNPPHVNFYKPLIKHYSAKDKRIICTARNFAETTKLLNLNNIEFHTFGKHYGGNKFKKAIGLLNREFTLMMKLEKFDVSFSSNYECPMLSWLRKKRSIVFDDNDISPNWLYSKFASYIISPLFIDKNLMYSMGIRPQQLITYDGFKEDIYIADYEPDSNFLSNLPFTEFITVRPENIYASYIPVGTKSIVPQLLEDLVKSGFNILYMPRYDEDHRYVKNNDKIYIPPHPLNGLDVCYYSQAVLTGAGTFSREAALMNTPAVSFYAGTKFLGVDKQMFSQNRVKFSKDIKEIVKFAKEAKKQPFSNIKSKGVQEQFLNIVDKLVT